MLAPATAEEAVSQRQSTAPVFASRARVSRLSAVKQPKAQTTAASTTSVMLCCPSDAIENLYHETISEDSNERSVNGPDIRNLVT